MLCIVTLISFKFYTSKSAKFTDRDVARAFVLSHSVHSLVSRCQRTRLLLLPSRSVFPSEQTLGVLCGQKIVDGFARLAHIRNTDIIWASYLMILKLTCLQVQLLTWVESEHRAVFHLAQISLSPDETDRKSITYLGWAFYSLLFRIIRTC